MDPGFSYQTAFARNIGWLTGNEQGVLRAKRVAIAGMGGVGGSHLITLARLGIGAFNIADFDTYELPNFNRQAGAMMSTLGRPKVEVMAAQARDINPEIDIRIFPEGIDTTNLETFLGDADVYLDGLDFFSYSAREAVFAACADLGIPAVTAAPLGMGAAVLNFLPDKMTFEEYFRLSGLPDEEKAVRFLIGLSPAMLQRTYLADPSAVDLARHHGPSTAMACQLCAGVAATEVLKLLLRRGKIRAAPHGIHYDAYRNKLAHTWRPGGFNNPLQRFAVAIAKRRLRGTAGLRGQTAPSGSPASVVEQILDVARWAPSGDNTQPWRFEILAPDHVVVHGFDTREHCIYDFRGRPSHMAHGALLESIRLAATGHGLTATMERRTDSPEHKPLYDVRLSPDPAVQPDPLLPYIPVRSVQRRWMSRRRLTSREKDTLEASVGAEYSLLWLESWLDKWRAARLMFANARLRLTLPEAYTVHREVIERNARFSRDRVPDRAVGLDPLTTRLMGWVMERWSRVDFFNTYLAGTWLPRLELDLLPSLACGAHFMIVAREAPLNIDDYVAAGRAMQRLWLTATRLGLQMQPEMTPLIFSAYAWHDVPFSQQPQAMKEALRLSVRLEQLGGEAARKAVFMGRIGAGQAPVSRSLRRPLGDLVVSGQQ